MTVASSLVDAMPDWLYWDHITVDLNNIKSTHKHPRTRLTQTGINIASVTVYLISIPASHRKKVKYLWGANLVPWASFMWENCLRSRCWQIHIIHEGFSFYEEIAISAFRDKKLSRFKNDAGIWVSGQEREFVITEKILVLLVGSSRSVNSTLYGRFLDM